jgi:hypothetical protein
MLYLERKKNFLQKKYSKPLKNHFILYTKHVMISGLKSNMKYISLNVQEIKCHNNNKIMIVKGTKLSLLMNH